MIPRLKVGKESEIMKPSALTPVAPVMWGGYMLLVGLINLADASYGTAILHVMSSGDLGADTQRTVLLGAL